MYLPNSDYWVSEITDNGTAAENVLIRIQLQYGEQVILYQKINIYVFVSTSKPEDFIHCLFGTYMLENTVFSRCKIVNGIEER